MKNLLLLVFLFITNLCFSQTKDSTSVDSLNLSKADSVRFYQYRLAFNDIKTENWSNEIKSQLNEIFMTDPSFCEGIGQYVFVSSKSVTISEVMKPFQNTDHKLTYFRKDPLLVSSK